MTEPAPVASVHIADVGFATALRVLRRAPKVGSIDGLRHADVGVALPLRASALPAPSLRRLGLIAFWDDDAAIDRFLDSHVLADRLANGWHARLEPLRAYGAWPGLPSEIAKQRTTAYTGSAVVLTLGRLRLTQTPRFLRTSGRAERRALSASGLLWGTALARPPFVATCSLWTSTDALSTYAYGPDEPAHPDAIVADKQKPFHHRSAFIRFRPYDVHGHLDGKNPLVERALSG